MKKPTILFVEDEKKAMNLYKNRLEKNGYQVIEAFSGELGLKLAQQLHPDLILLDILLPKMNGLELLRRLRADVWGKWVPVVILSNFKYQDWIDESLKLGVYQYLVKSEWKPQEVVDKINLELSEKK